MATANQAERDKQEAYHTHLKSFCPLCLKLLTGGVNKKLVDFCGMIAKKKHGIYFHQLVLYCHVHKSLPCEVSSIVLEKLQDDNARDILRKAHERRDSVRSFLFSSHRTRSQFLLKQSSYKNKRLKVFVFITSINQNDLYLL